MWDGLRLTRRAAITVTGLWFIDNRATPVSCSGTHCAIVLRGDRYGIWQNF